MNERQILIADDHAIIRLGMKFILDSQFNNSKVDEVEDSKSLFEALQRKIYTHLILDLQLQDSNTINIFSSIRARFPFLSILIYTMSSEETFGKRLLQMGASGFLSKQSNEAEVLKALHLFFLGRKYISNTMQEMLLKDTAGSEQKPDALNADAIGSDAACNGDSNGSVNLTVTGGTAPFTYLWSNGATTEDLTGIAAGTYSVTVTDDNGATASASATVGEPPVLSATCDHTDVTIYGGSDGSASVSIIGGTGPYTYLWSNGATTASISGLSAGTYSVTITDDHGCETSCASIVNDHVCSIEVIAGADVLKCHSQPTMLTASSSDQGATYSWSPATGLDNANIANPVTDVHATTTYTVTATGTDGCMATDVVTVTVYPVVKAKITVKPNTQSCGAPCVKLFTKNNPNYTYEWRKDGQPIIGAADKNTYCACVSGTYSVYVTDQVSGCTHNSKKMEITISQKLEDGDLVSAKTEMAMNAWPNPTTDQLFVTLTNTAEGAVKVQLMDMFGRQVKVADLGGSKEEQTIQFNMNELSSGMYIVRVLNGENRMEQKVMLIK